MWRRLNVVGKRAMILHSKPTIRHTSFRTHTIKIHPFTQNFKQSAQESSKFSGFILGSAAAAVFATTDDTKNQFLDSKLAIPPQAIPTASKEYAPPHEKSFFRKWLHRIRLFFRAIGIGIAGGVLLVTGVVAYKFPLMPHIFREWWNRALVFALGFGGACPTKLGQWAATRADLFSEELCRSLSQLHSSAPTHSFAATQEIIHSAFGKSVNDVFFRFDPNPIASGAIAQVYRASIKLNQFEYPVAVKIRHPGVVDNIYLDLSIIRILAKLSMYIPGATWMSVEENLETFASHMEQQLDLVREARNLDKFQINFAEFPNICFPRPVNEMTTQDILVESFEEGIPVSKYMSALESDETNGLNTSEKFKAQLASLGFTAFLKMIFVDNFIHADLHPGNILVRERGNSAQIVLLDAGLITTLSPKDRTNFIDLFTAVAMGDGEKGAQQIIDRAPPTGHEVTPEMQQKFVTEMRKLFDSVTSKPLSEVPIGRALLTVMNLCRECKVKIDGNFSALMTGLIVVEGLAKQLNAQFDLIKEARPLLATDPEFAKAYLKQKISGMWKIL